jgi:hypothetical protein
LYIECKRFFMEFGMIDGKVNFDDDFKKDTGLDPKANLTEYLLYCNLRMAMKVSDRVFSLETRIGAIEDLFMKLPDSMIDKVEERRRKRNTL